MASSYHVNHFRHIADPLYTRLGFDRIVQYNCPDGSTYEACPCFYCGEPATEKDHAYPFSALERITRLECLPLPEMMVVVPSCSECNALLHKKVFRILAMRKQYVKERLHQRYANLGGVPPLNISVLNLLDPYQQVLMLVMLQCQATLERRLRF